MINKYIKSINIGKVKLENNVFLAPMAGITDIPFRRICKKFNPGLMYTEMASSKAMEFSSQKTEKLLEIDECEKPSAVQIFGSNKEAIKNTILKLNENENIDIIDINMGCPAPKLVKNGDGAGLLLDLKNIDGILNEAVKCSKKEITVKTRRGFDEEHITAIEVAKICENNGVSCITVHGRTREQYYSGVANLEIIAKVKQTVSIPVIGNGDIVDVDSAINMFKNTNCDGIMIARAAQGNPWIFKSILDGENYEIPNYEKLEIMLEHIKYQLEFDNERQANLKLRKHIACYLKSMKNSSVIKDMINKSESIEKTINILKEYFSSLR